MPGPPHIIRSPALLGINESSRSELIDFGTNNLRAENVRQNHTGEAGTRFGFAALPNARLDGTSPVAGYKLISDHASPVRICDGQIESYSSKAAAWSTLGRVSECSASLTSLVSLGASGTLEDVDATANGYIALSWLVPDSASNSTAYAAIVDQATGAVVRAPEAVTASLFYSATISTPMLLGVIGNKFVAVRISTGNRLLAWSLDATSPATIAAGWVAYGAALCSDATYGYVLHSLPNQGKIAVAYPNVSGTANGLTCMTVSTSGVVQTQTLNTTSTTPDHVGIGGVDTDTLWLTWNETVSVYVCGLDPANITATLKASKSAALYGPAANAPLGVYIAGSTTTGKARLWVNGYGSSPIGVGGNALMVGIKTVAAAAVADGLTATCINTRMCRKPFFYAGRYYSAFFSGDFNNGGTAVNAQANFIVCDWSDTANTIRPVANLAPSLSSVGLGGLGKFVANYFSASTIYAGLDVKRSGVASASQLATLDFADARRWQTCAWGNSTYLSGGIATCFDGVRVAEVGFLLRPPQPVATQSGTGITAAVGWRYVCVYEEVDADGNWHQSGLSTPSDPTGAVTNKTMVVTTPPLSITARNISTTASTNARAVRVVFYRTLDGGNAPYYRLGSTTNDPSSPTVTFSDAVLDATLAANAKLYEQPGVLNTSQDKRPPPFFSCVTSYNGMLVGASGSDVWYSGQNVSGEGVWFNPIFQVPVPGDGPITAIWAMDGTLFVAKRREIYAIAGEAPSDNGASGGLGLPRRLAVDVGCIEPRSVCVTALGVFFQSERGIEILTRAHTVTWIGQKYQDTMTLFPIVTSITIDPSSSDTVLVELAASQSAGLVSGAGRTLVYDLTITEWVSSDRRTSSIGAANAPSQSACVIYTGTVYRYAWIAANGVVHYEDRTTYLDANGSFVTPLIETGWLNLFQNEQRVYRVAVLFKRFAAAGLKVEIAYNYADYAALDTAAWTEADTLGQRQLEFAPSPRAESMKMRITATAPVTPGTGQGIAVFAISVDLAGKQGPTKGTLRLDPALRR